MDMISKGKAKKNLILKTWERCRSIGSGKKGPNGSPFGSLPKSKSWSYTSSPYSTKEDKRKIMKRRVVPEGCFTVYVGPEKQRFVIKTQCVNHPLFKMLLEEAELEYGFNSEGPLALPCNVDLFYKVLSEMDSDEIRPNGCNFAKGHGSYRPLISPSRMVTMDRF